MLDDDTINRIMPELATLMQGIASVANLPECDLPLDPANQPLIDICQSIANRYSVNKTPLVIILLGIEAASRVPRNAVRGMEGRPDA